ncbi:NACHT domain-containing protein [Parafilimonas sp.]|uniref:NACHT domain-containing protein n=1 Tax=Parafilimonas sp. TaxID=1969739 RepID=UPI003F7CF2A2
MISNSLNWNKFNWDYFQQLCILIAEFKFPGCDFQEYLKQGNKQSGTDLLSFNYQHGQQLNVQCKKVKKLTEADLEKIVSEFTGNELAAKSSHFILATSIDTNNKKLITAIAKFKEELLSKYGIEFHCWGRQDIEKYLKSNWGIVSHFFGKEAADLFCIPQQKYIYIKPVNDYIPRKIYKSVSKGIEWMSWNSGRQLDDLIPLLDKERILSKRICIIGDAYQGKSSYLKQAAFELQHNASGLQPLFLEIKDVFVASLESILDEKFRYWKNIPLKDIMLFIDGLDEAPTDRFRDIVTHIKQFADSYPSVSIIVTCRKQFYDQLGIKEKLQQFELFELYGIRQEDRNNYLSRILKGSIDDFVLLADKSKITGFLSHPFYLVNLVEEYNMSGQIPSNRIDIIKLFLNKSFENSLKRRIKNGQVIQDAHIKFEQVIIRFALAMQFAGVNAFKYEQVQELFDIDEIELLRHNSMISINNNSWSFVNAMFQEYLAALLLSQLSFQQIVKYSTVGTHIRKIKGKWVQTISTLLSILPLENPLYSQVFSLIEQDNIELLFQTEPSRFDSTFKLDLLQKLIEKCIKTNARTTIIYEDTIGRFIDGINTITSYLLSCLNRRDVSERIKDMCIRILLFTDIPAKFKTEILETVVNGIDHTSDPYYAGQLVKLLTSNKIGNLDLLNKLSKYFPEKHAYRDDLYSLITALRLSDSFYDYALAGIPFLIKYNKEIDHHGSSFSLEDLLVSTNSRANYWKLFNKMQDKSWLELYGSRSVTSKDFIAKLFDKCIEIYKTDPLIIFPIAFYIPAIGKQHLREDFKDIDRFLEETGTHWVVTRILIKKIFADHNWEIGALITSDTYDYVLFEYEETNDLKGLQNCLSGLRYKQKEEISNQFSQLCEDATEGRIFDKRHWGENETYLKLEEQRRLNDRKYIATVIAFKQGVINYFNAYGKKAIPDDELYIDVDNSFERRKFDSRFIFSFLSKFRNKKEIVLLNDCLKWLDNEKNFEIFRIEEILHYSINEEDKQFYLEILKNYYYKKLPEANFENCKWEEGDRFHWRKLEIRLGNIFEKFELETSESYLIEMIWLDAGGLRTFETNKVNNRQSIAELIIKNLSPAGIGKLKEQILLNIQKGIKLDSVLGTHLALCRQLKIKKAKDEILNIILEKRYGRLYLGDIADIYLELGGNISSLSEFISRLDNYNEYWYTHLIELIEPTYPAEAISSLTKALESSTTSNETKIVAARHLAHLGDIYGFKFLMNFVRINKKSPYSIQGRLSIHNVDTVLALKEIEDLMYLVVEERFKNHSHFSENASNILLELLNGFAGKSESDLEIVTKFCEQSMAHLLEEGYHNATDFNFYNNRMIENFRNSDQTIVNISEIQSILKTIDR